MNYGIQLTKPWEIIPEYFKQTINTFRVNGRIHLSEPWDTYWNMNSATDKVLRGAVKQLKLSTLGSIYNNTKCNFVYYLLYTMHSLINFFHAFMYCIMCNV